MPEPGSVSRSLILRRLRRRRRLLRLLRGRTGLARTRAFKKLLQLFAIDLRRLACGNAIFIRDDPGIRTLRYPLLIRRQSQERRIFFPILVGAQFQRNCPVRQHRDDSFAIPKQNHKEQVNDDRYPNRFPLARTRKVVLQLNQKMRNILRIEAAISCFPILGLEKLAMLRLGRRRGGRRRGIARRYLGDWHQAATIS